jgi:hypothetical protein
MHGDMMLAAGDEAPNFASGDFRFGVVCRCLAARLSPIPIRRVRSPRLFWRQLRTARAVSSAHIVAGMRVADGSGRSLFAISITSGISPECRLVEILARGLPSPSSPATAPEIPDEGG